MNRLKLFTSFLLFVTTVFANDSTKTDISFQRDDSGNLNPSLFLPIYYGSSNQFYSGFGYTSSNYIQTDVLDGFEDSKNALVSSSKIYTLNYLTYTTPLFGYEFSFGVESMFSKIKNNEFGYIHDSANLFENGEDYYISFDNEVELDIKRHGVVFDVLIPMGEYLNSRIYTSISPYTTIGVKQTTIFKPLVDEVGSSSSTTSQTLSYTLKYELQTNSTTFFDIGFSAKYEYQSLKYDVAQLTKKDNTYIFETNTIDTVETTKSYIVKLLVNRGVLGGLKPSIGFGKEYFSRKDNNSEIITKSDKKIVTFGFEKMF